MKPSLSLEPVVGPNWHYAAELGITDIVAIRDQTDEVPIWDLPVLERVKKTYEDFGFRVAVLEGWVPFDSFRLRKPDADLDLKRMIAVIENMGKLGIGVLCYSWMAVNNWTRTSTATPTRGGALTSSYDHAVSERDPRSRQGIVVSEDLLWETLEQFLKAIVPVAEKAGVKLAIHPDDPPLSPLFGVGRIMRSVEAFDTALKLVDSPANGITFCQGNFAAMNADVPAAIRHLGRDGRIHFAHFRDIVGDAYQMTETFHDAGKTDMLAAMRAYRDIGFSGVMRTDHAPVMWGEDNGKPGYKSLGHIYAIGYMRGLMEAVAADAGR